MSLREAAQAALHCLETSRVFVTSRERIKRPEGEDFYDETVNALRDALAEAPKQGCTEFAPPNSLPTWDECAVRVDNSNFIEKRAAEGGHGPEPDSKLATQLHRFIHEYDDADPVRSSWFLHRLELVLHEVRRDALAEAEKAEPAELSDEDAAIAKAWTRFTAELENPSPLTDEEILEIWSPSLDGSVQRPILGKNKILAFARAVLAYAANAAARGKG